MPGFSSRGPAAHSEQHTFRLSLDVERIWWKRIHLLGILALQQRFGLPDIFKGHCYIL